MEKQRPCTVLTIAGSDSGGGAGIQADIKSISANGCFALSVVTAVTAQNSFEVTDIHKLPLTNIKAQMKAVFDDFPIDAVKIGMLADQEIIHFIADFLHHKKMPIILDPVMVATSGALLLESQAVSALKEALLPLASLITPNIPEAQILSGLSKVNNPLTLAENIQTSSPILVKGGHNEGVEVTDILYMNKEEKYTFTQSKIQTKNTHGTGCSLSSAIAAQIAQGEKVPQAVEKAHHYIFEAIKAAKDWRLGKKHGPIAHFDYN